MKEWSQLTRDAAATLNNKREDYWDLRPVIIYLDEKVQGLAPGNLIVLAVRPNERYLVPLTKRKS